MTLPVVALPVAALPVVAGPPATDTDRIGVTSMTIPAVEERPAKQCPPLRGTARQPEPARHREGLGHVAGGRAEHDGLRPGVVEAGDGGPAGLVIAGRAGPDDLARDRGLQRRPVGG